MAAREVWSHAVVMEAPDGARGAVRGDKGARHVAWVGRDQVVAVAAPDGVGGHAA